MFQLIKRLLSWIRTDGKLHIFACALIAFSFWPFVGPWWAGAIAAVFGIGKEIKDRISGKGTAEWHDLICDGLGIAYFYIVVCLTLLLT